MAYQHVLPAAVIGGFGAVPEKRLRDSRVAVRRRGDTARVGAARSVGGRNDYYGVSDAWWESYEGNLPQAISELSVSGISA